MRLINIVTAAEETPPAGGAAFDEILIAGAMASVVMLVVGWEVLRERSGHTTLVGRLADKISEIDGLPRWAGLPAYLTVLSLLTAAFGVWWDVPIHMQNGRDEGSLANPSHYPIFFGILGFAHAGILSVGLAKDPLPRRVLKLSRKWVTPYGGLVILAAGLIALVGFPADDLWHRLFGQDVTEWGPTHVMMIGGAVTCCLGIPLLLAEAHQTGARGTRTLWGRYFGLFAISLCIAPMAFLMEFDLGVPQYPAATQVIIAGFLMAWIFTAARAWYGPGGAILSGLIYLGIHSLIILMILPLPGVLEARFLLFLPGAVLVELVALAFDPQRKRIPFALVSALLVGTIGLLAEWWWSTFFMPLPQPFEARMLPYLIPVGTVAALGGGLTGAWFAARIRDVAGDPSYGLKAPDPGQEANGWAELGWGRWYGLAGFAVFVGLMAAFAPPSAGDGDLSGTVSFDERCPGGEEQCLATVTVQLHPADAAEDAVWFYALSWQGRGGDETDEELPKDPVSGDPGIVRVEMEPTGEPGQFVSADPVPMYGNWKTLLRLHQWPRTMIAIPLHAPDDEAIDSPNGREIVASDGDEVDFVLEQKFLQRERKQGTPLWLDTTAYGVVMLSWILVVMFYGWCYGRASRPGEAGAPVSEETKPSERV